MCAHRQADIILWDFKTLKEKARFPLHKVKVQALAFSPNEKFLVSLGGQVLPRAHRSRQDDGTVVVWDLEKGSALCGSPVSAAAAGVGYAVQFCNRSDTTFVTGGDGTIRVWEIDAAHRKMHPADVSLGALRRVVHCLQVSDDDEFAYLGTTSGDIVQVWRRACRVCVRALRAVHAGEQGLRSRADQRPHQAAAQCRPGEDQGGDGRDRPGRGPHGRGAGGRRQRPSAAHACRRVEGRGRGQGGRRGDVASAARGGPGGVCWYGGTAWR